MTCGATDPVEYGFASSGLAAAPRQSLHAPFPRGGVYAVWATEPSRQLGVRLPKPFRPGFRVPSVDFLGGHRPEHLTGSFTEPIFFFASAHAAHQTNQREQL